MDLLNRIFRRRKEQEPQPLRVEGVAAAPMTAEPDDAELAAQALLERMARKGEKETQAQAEPERNTKEYYRTLAERMRLARAASALRTTRFVAFCEQELQKPDIPVSGPGSLTLLEAELYKRIDTIEREGGALKRRWQHCLAEVTVRLMQVSQAQEDANQGL